MHRFRNTQKAIDQCKEGLPYSKIEIVTLDGTIIQQGIDKDVTYSARLISDIRDMGDKALASIVPMCLVPYISLFAHESFAKLKATNPALSASLSSDVEQIVARSRHSLKLFEDTHRGIDGQLAYFRDEILASHMEYFRGKTWVARWLGRDLGLYSYNGRLIGTTHSATFNLGIEPRSLLRKKGPELQATYVEYGRYLAALGARLDVLGQTFVSHLDPRSLNPRTVDVQSEKYYRRVFDGPANPDLNALLTFFQCMMNFVQLITIHDAGAFDYSAFKIRFLTLYQVLGSLRMLRDDPLPVLSARSTRFVDRLVDSAETHLILDRNVKPFRNTLMHYNLNPHVDRTQVDVAKPLFGLVPIYFPAHTATSFVAAVDQHIAEVATTMDEWAAAY
jgi:hypothetical protein